MQNCVLVDGENQHNQSKADTKAILVFVHVELNMVSVKQRQKCSFLTVVQQAVRGNKASSGPLQRQQRTTLRLGTK